MLLALVGAALALGCGEPSRPPPVLLIGVDGLEWDVVLPLVRDGRMPALAALMERGRYGLLETIRPTLSPVIWTSMATGKPRERHGIRGFLRRAGREPVLYTNRDRRTKAFWNVASEAGRRVAVVGWWMTWPVEKVNGVMVAQTNTVEAAEVAGGRTPWKGSLREGEGGQVYPPERTAEMLDVLADVDASLDEELERVFGGFRHPLGPLEQHLWESCAWAFRADATYARIARRLLEDDGPFDVLAVYLGGPDVVGHRFWRYRDPALYRQPPSPEQVENLGGVIDDYTAHVDGVIGALVAAAPDDARVIVVSDHGMQPSNLHGAYDPEDPEADLNSGHHALTAPPGVLVAAGPGIAPTGAPAPDLARRDLEPVAGALDLAPTLLVLMGLPPGRDMEGRLPRGFATDEFLAEHPITFVESHDTPEWQAARSSLRGGRADSDERIRQLRELGYIE